MTHHRNSRSFNSRKLSDPVVQEEFRDAVNSRIEFGSSGSTNEARCQWKAAVQDAAANDLGYERGRREELISEETWILI